METAERPLVHPASCKLTYYIMYYLDHMVFYFKMDYNSINPQIVVVAEGTGPLFEASLYWRLDFMSLISDISVQFLILRFYVKTSYI